MASTSEIEKLERRHAENPQGRFFAPLADAYRKAGQVDQALVLVRMGLENHPDYLSAHIVLGRCLLDKKDDAEASQAFQKVLTLDSENIIALKSLAEIQERGGDLVAAREWLQKLLAVDPMNAEAEADLQRLGGAIAKADTAPMEAIAVEEPPSAEISFADVIPAAAAPPADDGLGLEPTAFGAVAAGAAPEATLEIPRVMDGIEPVEFAPPAEEVPPPAAEIAPFDDALSWGAGERSSRAVSADDVERAMIARDDALAMPADEVVPPESAASHVAPEPVPLEEPAPGADEAWSVRPSLQTTRPDLATFELATEEESAWGAAAPEASGEAFSLPEALEGGDAVPGAGDAGELEMPELAPAEMEPVAAGSAAPGLGDLPLIMPEDVTPAEELQVEAPAPEAAPLLTETMGDLYLKQGFRAEAADVYRRLLEQRPGDAGLAAKLAEIEGPPPVLSAAALGAESTRAWLRRLAQARVLDPAAAAVPPEAAEGPSPMDQAFAQPEPEVVEPVGEPTRPAQDSFTLDAIFGAQGASPPPPPEPPQPPPPPTGTSFDEFFGGPPDQGSVRPEAPQLAAAPPPEDDIGSFNAWLHGLKR